MPEDFGAYRILEKIASGGMAQVYLARHHGIEGLARSVVLKRIHAQYSSDEEFVTMFLDEARLLAAISHPNVAQVLDLGRTDDSYYLVMEYVRGPTLEQLVQACESTGRIGPPIETALSIVLHIAEALAYLHELRDEYGRPLQLVHRDLNPTNVMIGHNGSVKLIDFGIAKSAVKVYETRQGMVKGTYGYIAPEQLKDTRSVDFRADLFSLGVLLYEITTGELPFGPGESPLLVERMLNKQYKPPSELNPEFPKDLEPLISQTLDPDPGNRPANMHAFANAIADHMRRAGIVPTMGRLAESVRQFIPDPDEERAITLRNDRRQKPRDPQAGTLPTGNDSDDITHTAVSAFTPSMEPPAPAGTDPDMDGGHTVPNHRLGTDALAPPMSAEMADAISDRPALADARPTLPIWIWPVAAVLVVLAGIAGALLAK